MTEIAQKLAAWKSSGKTGASSKTMAAFFMGEQIDSPSYPHDASDLGRCIGLLEAVPEFGGRVDELAELPGLAGQCWAALAVAWNGLEEIYHIDHAECTKRMKTLLNPLEDASGRVIRMGSKNGVGVSIHLPDNPLGNMMKEGMEISYSVAVTACLKAGEVTHTIIQRATGLNTELCAQLIQRMKTEGIVAATGKNGMLVLTEKALKSMKIAEKIMEVSEATGVPASKVLEKAKEAVGIGHNSGDDADTSAAMGGNSGDVSGARLKAYIERIERLEEEKKVLAEDVRDIYGEAKATGFDAKIIRKIVSLRRSNLEKRREEQELLELYMSAIGMAE